MNARRKTEKRNLRRNGQNSGYVVPDERTKIRKCLRCDRDFYSMHGGNRICQRCSGSETWHELLMGFNE